MDENDRFPQKKEGQKDFNTSKQVLHRTLWKGISVLLFVSGIDVSLDVLDNVIQKPVFLNGTFDFLDRIVYGRVIAAAELFADLLQRHFDHGTDQVHGHLSGLKDLGFSSLTDEGLFLNGVGLCHLVNDDFGGGENVALIPENVTHSTHDGVHVHLFAQQGLEGQNLIDGTLQLTDVGGDVFRNVIQNRFGQLQTHADGLVFNNGYAGLIVGRIDLGDKAHGEAALQSLIQSEDVLGRTVGGKDDLLIGVPKGIEGVEHLLLSGLTAGDKLDVVHEEEVGAAVLVVELILGLFTNGLNELIGERVSLDKDHVAVGVVLLDLVTDGVEEVGLYGSALYPNVRRGNSNDDQEPHAS